MRPGAWRRCKALVQLGLQRYSGKLGSNQCENPGILGKVVWLWENACSSMQRHKGHGGLVAVLLSTSHNVLRCRLRQYLQPCTQFTGEPLKCNKLECGGGAGLTGSCEPIVNVSGPLHTQDHRTGNAIWPLRGYLYSRGYASHQGQSGFALFLFLSPPQLGVQCLPEQLWEWGVPGGFTWLDQQQP